MRFFFFSQLSKHFLRIKPAARAHTHTGTLSLLTGVGSVLLIQKCKEIWFPPDFFFHRRTFSSLVSFNAVFGFRLLIYLLRFSSFFFPPTFQRTIPNTFGGRAVQVKCIFESYTVAFSVYIWPLLLGKVGKTLFISEMVRPNFHIALPFRVPVVSVHTHTAPIHAGLDTLV